MGVVARATLGVGEDAQGVVHLLELGFEPQDSSPVAHDGLFPICTADLRLGGVGIHSEEMVVVTWHGHGVNP